MAETTTIRISRDTHGRVTRLAAERHETIDETVRNTLAGEIMAETMEAFDYALASPNPTEQDLYTHVYAD